MFSTDRKWPPHESSATPGARKPCESWMIMSGISSSIFGPLFSSTTPHFMLYLASVICPGSEVLAEPLLVFNLREIKPKLYIESWDCEFGLILFYLGDIYSAPGGSLRRKSISFEAPSQMNFSVMSLSSYWWALLSLFTIFSCALLEDDIELECDGWWSMQETQ